MSVPGASLDQLAQWALFGHAQSTPPPVDTVQSSSLGLRLEGIISGSTPPLVMLGIGNAVKLLQVGASISPQVTVHAIEPDRVILSNQGRLEAIRFPHPVSLNVTPPPSVDMLQSPATPASSAHTTPSAPSGTGPTAQSLLHNPQSLLQYIRLTPLERGGQQVGLVLHPVPGQATWLARLGLADGDVLTEADGRSVTNGNLLPHLLPLLRAGQPIPVTIERDGRPMHLTINLDALR